MGNGTTTEENSPVEITLATGVEPTAISAGQYHSLAIGSDGNLYAWGYNATGQLGNATTTEENSPVEITLASGVDPVAIAAGTEDSYAIGSNGKLYAWRYNGGGALGDGTTTDEDRPRSYQPASGRHRQGDSCRERGRSDDRFEQRSLRVGDRPLR
jgi:alpha-tubulin suppressor-like RCC1 family protein